MALSGVVRAPLQMCGKWYRGTLDRSGGEFDSESAEKGPARVYRNWDGRRRGGMCRFMSGFRAEAGPPTCAGLASPWGRLGTRAGGFPRLTSKQQIGTPDAGKATKFGTLVGSPNGPELGAPGC
jgi:hypothetical protein